MNHRGPSKSWFTYGGGCTGWEESKERFVNSKLTKPTKVWFFELINDRLLPMFTKSFSQIIFLICTVWMLFSSFSVDSLRLMIVDEDKLMLHEDIVERSSNVLGNKSLQSFQWKRYKMCNWLYFALMFTKNQFFSHNLMVSARFQNYIWMKVAYGGDNSQCRGLAHARSIVLNSQKYKF